MLQLFNATTKVQKDRQVMRDTDARVAKYSRRGLVLNFLVFILTLAFFGDFYQSEQHLAIALVTGLLLVTLLRSYFLFRFDTLYARAPGRWRNQYFIASFLGAAWWSVILVTLTWVHGMRNETLVMWLYSVVFYSSVANVFAPYRRFLAAYLFIGQIPAAVTAILLGHAEGYLYGIIMLVFFSMITHQAKVTCNTYWERLEANHALQERARGLEFEQRSSQASIELKNEFLVNLGQELRSSLNDILGTLALVDDDKLSERHRELLLVASKAAERQLDLVNNVVDFSKITTKSLNLEEENFDLRRLLEKLVQDFALEAHQLGIELNYLLDAELPNRVRGDATRLGQILSTLLNHALKYASLGQVFIEAVFHPDENENGELQIVISDSASGAPREPGEEEGSLAVDEELRGIGLSICKGLAECMGGSVHVLEKPQGGKRTVINIKLEVISHATKGFAEEQKLRGRGVLLVDFPETVAMDLTDQLSGWGMRVNSSYGREQTMAKIREVRQRKQPLDLVLIYNALNSFNALPLSRELASDPETAELKQVIAMSVLQRDTPELEKHLGSHSQVSCIDKPIMHRRLHDVMVQRLIEHDNRELDTVQAHADMSHHTPEPRILLVEDHRVDQMVISGMLKKLGCRVHIAIDGKDALSALSKEKFDLVLMDCDIPELDALAAITELREDEKASNIKRHLPVVAMTSYDNPEEETRCLAAGMDDQVLKPLRYEELRHRLERWLGHSGSTDGDT
ncbi:response regulator [Marinimicrobium sp. ABcell2]|uniref:response regulator n=1 Tax=Marinimicrobium sp. ABcell2 TaxID=3069751 RepID=UPI0027ADCF05|nr:response regulator [Marinimicrobium sp. ABcell2]MDQ2077238.1 response regulator [Marinimicrobium sp. ABcell2]